MSTATRCLVADDHPALVAAVSQYLCSFGFDVVGPARDGREALALLTSQRPEAALVDYRMPWLSEAGLITQLVAASPDTRICVYTGDADTGLAEDVLAAGARAIVLKESPLRDVVRAIEVTLDGGTYVDPAIGGDAGATARLTQRELDVLVLLAEGLAHDEIGERLGIGSETVRTHLRKACGRLGAATRTQAVATALRLGLIA